MTMGWAPQAVHLLDHAIEVQGARICILGLTYNRFWLDLELEHCRSACPSSPSHFLLGPGPSSLQEANSTT